MGSKRLLDAYAGRGAALPSSLKGAFSFALDDRKKKQILCARDPLGIAPLYYARYQDAFHFSTSIGDLLSLEGMPKRPNLHAMRTMMRGFAVDDHETMYEGIYRLPPGHTLAVENGDKRIERTWFPEKIKIDYSVSEKAAAQEIKRLLALAVQRCVDDLEETAFEVSGGLDSTAVASLAAQRYGAQRLDSYSMRFERLQCDESEYVDAFLEKYPTRHRKIESGNLDYRKRYSLDHLYTLSPHWPVTLTFAMILPMLERMKRDGKRVVITGQGGDHLFTGSPYVLYELLARGRLASFYRELRSHRRPWPAFKAYVLKPFLGEARVDALRKALGREPLYQCFWDHGGIENLSDRLGIRNPARKHDLDSVTSAYHSTVMDGNIFHAAEKRFGLEFRHPFFDKELVEFALSLPPEMKYGNRSIKRIFREAMKGILPEKVRLRRDKAEFSELIRQQMEAIDIEALLRDPHIVRLGVATRQEVDRCLHLYREGKLRYISYLWAMINVEAWYRYNRFED